MTYNPDTLLDTLILNFGLKTDAELARKLNEPAPIISKIRHRRLPINARFIIKVHEVSGLSIKEIRGLMGDFRETFSETRCSTKESPDPSFWEAIVSDNDIRAHRKKA